MPSSGISPQPLHAESDMDDDYLTLEDLPTRRVGFNAHRTTSLQAFSAVATIDNTGTDDQRPANDFLALMTATAELYAQDGVLEMQSMAFDRRRPMAQGASSQVHTINAAFTSLSTTATDTLDREERRVIMKRSPKRLFNPKGHPHDLVAASGLLTELRILSYPEIRNADNIVTLLGLYWDSSNLISHEPIFVLEYGAMTLSEFQNINDALPFSTKLSLALDIARGLTVLHQNGVIHGDIKPENILMFGPNPWKAKLADFGASVFDTGETRFLVGGTTPYAAPEWQTQAPTGVLKQTDVYSYGLVFAEIMIGFDVVALIFRNNFHHLQAASLDRMKAENTLHQYLFDQICHVDARESLSHIDNIPLVKRVLDLSVQKDPGRRSLPHILEALGTELPEAASYQIQRVSHLTLLQKLSTTNLSIPYSALNNIGGAVKQQVLHSLLSIAKSEEDGRAAASFFELCVCYSSGFGLGLGGPNYSEARRWLIKAATAGHPWALSVCHRVCGMAHGEIVGLGTMKEWLSESVVQGSRVALRCLESIDPDEAARSLNLYRQTFCGNPEILFGHINPELEHGIQPNRRLTARGDTILHWAASVGHLDWTQTLLSCCSSQELDVKNGHGDTAILCAMRAGHHEIVLELLQAGADTSINNGFNESPLHFLDSLDERQIKLLAIELVKSGADLFAEASNHSGNASFETKPMIAGCPLARMAAQNSYVAFAALLDAESYFSGSKAASILPRANSKFRRIVARAVKLCHVEILYILKIRLQYFSLVDFNEIMVWENRRRVSLPALCILGNASAFAQFGFDWPEKFWRLVNFGGDHAARQGTTLQLLRSLGVDLVYAPHGGTRNAVFLAVKECRRDALQWLLSTDIFDAGEVFGEHKVDRRKQFLTFEVGLQYSTDFSERPPQQRPKLNGVPFCIRNPRESGEGTQWALVDAVMASISRGHSDIFSDLLRASSSLALRPIAVPYFECRPAPKVFELSSRWTRFCHSVLHDDGAKRPKYYERPNFYYSWSNRCLVSNTERTAEIDLALLYMTLISRSEHHDISFAHALLGALSSDIRRLPRSWTTKCRILDIIMHQSTGTHVNTPLYHSAIRCWDKLTRLLLNHRATTQDLCMGDVTGYRPESPEFSDFRRDQCLSFDDWYPGLGSQSILMNIQPRVGPLDMKHMEIFRGLLQQAAASVTDGDSDQSIITADDITQFLNQRYQELEYCGWDNGKIYSRASQPYEQEFWHEIVLANKAQLEQITPQPRHHQLLRMAAEMHNYFAVQELLDMNFDPNDCNLNPWRQPHITALDVVMCRAQLLDEECTESGKKLRAESRELARLLEKQGGLRGLEYNRGFQVSCVAGRAVLGTGLAVLMTILAFFLSTTVMNRLGPWPVMEPWEPPAKTGPDFKDWNGSTPYPWVPTPPNYDIPIIIFWLVRVSHILMFLACLPLLLRQSPITDFFGLDRPGSMYTWLIEHCKKDEELYFYVAIGLFGGLSLLSVIYWIFMVIFGAASRTNFILAVNVAAASTSGLLAGLALLLFLMVAFESSPGIRHLAEQYHGGNTALAWRSTYWSWKPWTPRSWSWNWTQQREIGKGLLSSAIKLAERVWAKLGKGGKRVWSIINEVRRWGWAKANGLGQIRLTRLSIIQSRQRGADAVEDATSREQLQQEAEEARLERRLEWERSRARGQRWAKTALAGVAKAVPYVVAPLKFVITTCDKISRTSVRMWELRRRQRAQNRGEIWLE